MAVARANKVSVLCADRVGTERGQRSAGRTCIVSEQGSVVGARADAGVVAGDLDGGVLEDPGWPGTRPTRENGRMASTPGDATTWEEVARRLEDPRNYWLVTVGPQGAPHAAPVWGVVHDGSLHCFSTRASQKAKNLVRDDRALVHLEDGERAVIVHGRLVDIGSPAHSPDLVEAFAHKYTDPDDLGFLPRVEPDPDAGYVVDVFYRLEPSSAVLWTLADFDGSLRHWRLTRTA